MYNTYFFSFVVQVFVIKFPKCFRLRKLHEISTEAAIENEEFIVHYLESFARVLHQH